MKRYMRYGWLVVGLCVGLLVVGCAPPYYKVTDPQSGKEYYTEKVDTLSGGAVKVMDARTNSVVTLQNSQVKEISEKEYKAGLAAPVSKPTPTAAPSSGRGTGIGTCSGTLNDTSRSRAEFCAERDVITSFPPSRFERKGWGRLESRNERIPYSVLQGASIRRLERSTG